MKLSYIKVPVITLSPDELEAMSETQQEREKELRLKLNQYFAMLKTFVQKYSGETMKHRTIEEVLKGTGKVEIKLKVDKNENPF